MIKIKKGSGEIEPFNEKKLLNSLIKAGATQELAKEVIEEIKPKIYDKITTKKLYKITFKTLKKISHTSASRYEIKWALMRLGPQGFSFEKYIAAMMEELGYKVKTNQKIQGKCVIHEIDVIAEKGSKKIMIECKHKSKLGLICRIKDVMCTWARYNDLKDTFNEVWLVSNLRFSSDAKQYSKGMNLKLLGWCYPSNNSLEKIINKLKLYPVTVLKTVNKRILKKLLDEEIVLAATLSIQKPNILAKKIKITQKEAKKIINEAREL